MSKDLLKEAIADAKAVRETAIANAKIALQEAFTPKIKSMLAAQISEEEEEEMEMDSDEVSADSVDTISDEPISDEPISDDEFSDDEFSDDEFSDDEFSDDDEEDLELEALIRELEAEDEEDSIEVPDDVTSDVSSDVAADVAAVDDVPAEEDDEEIDLDELLRELHMDSEELDSEEEVEDEEKESELQAAYEVIRSLKNTINEVNILNAKLLFSNKLFRNHNLSEAQKVKVINNFDRARTVREIKLVYSTLAESLNGTRPKKSITEGLASKTVASTKPKNTQIVESNQFADRMKKLAGLL